MNDFYTIITFVFRIYKSIENDGLKRFGIKKRKKRNRKEKKRRETEKKRKKKKEKNKKRKEREITK